MDMMLASSLLSVASPLHRPGKPVNSKGVTREEREWRKAKKKMAKQAKRRNR